MIVNRSIATMYCDFGTYTKPAAAQAASTKVTKQDAQPTPSQDAKDGRADRQVTCH